MYKLKIINDITNIPYYTGDVGYTGKSYIYTWICNFHAYRPSFLEFSKFTKKYKIPHGKEVLTKLFDKCSLNPEIISQIWKRLTYEIFEEITSVQIPHIVSNSKEYLTDSQGNEWVIRSNRFYIEEVKLKMNYLP